MENLVNKIRRNTTDTYIEDIREDINRSLTRLEEGQESLFLELSSQRENYQKCISTKLSKRTLETWESFMNDETLENFTLFVNSFSIDYGILLAKEDENKKK